MDFVDGSDRYENETTDEPSPSLLTIVLDTNPHAWAVLKPTLSLSQAVVNILVFINAHLAINHFNQVALIASHCHRATFLYPRSAEPSQDGDTEMGGTDTYQRTEDPTKYRPFALLERDVLASMQELIDSTTPSDLSSTTTTSVAGALSLALSYTNRCTTAFSNTGGTSTSKTNSANGDDKQPSGLQSRILVISVSGDLAHQYIPIMNSTFAGQRLRIPIDVLKLAGDTVFLQQASDATGGTYLSATEPQGLLQYLMLAFLPDQSSRKYLISAGGSIVDFRAACFCHRKVIDVGFVCSVCLSIFCEPPEGATCLTCQTYWELTGGNYGNKPAVLIRRRKKRRKVGANGTPVGTPGGTPAPGD